MKKNAVPKIKRVDVLCGCGWGLLSIPEDGVPDCCPNCDRDIGGEDNTDDDEWRRERAMQAGMAGGCDAYNEKMGCSLDSPED